MVQIIFVRRIGLKNPSQAHAETMPDRWLYVLSENQFGEELLNYFFSRALMKLLLAEHQPVAGETELTCGVGQERHLS